MKTMWTISFYFLLPLSLHLIVVNGDPTKIDSELLDRLERGYTADVVVSFVNGVEPALERAAALRINDPSEHNQAIVDELITNADESQESVLHLLASLVKDPGKPSLEGDAKFKEYKSYWLGNKVVITKANELAVLKVANDPTVLRIREETVGKIPDVPEIIDEAVKRDVDEGSKQDSWAIDKIQVEAAWEELGGNKGEGVTVGIIDTGVHAEHEAIRDNFIGLQYGWYDAAKNSPEPIDEHGHGTHVIGSFVGSHGIGVAPGARWMVCRACSKSTCEGLRGCIQWMACPTLPDGSQPDCSKAPQIINNSWVRGRGDDSFNEEIMAWRALGIIPVFGIGNDGPKCNTTNSPGEFPFVIGVGATDVDDYIYHAQSVGYSSDGDIIKPDIVAPGVEVLSSVPPFVSEDGYGFKEGTSMASPHVAGVVALLKAREPGLTFEQAYDYLTQNADQTATLHPRYERYFCNESTTNEYPNIFTGYGRVNALRAVQAQTQALNA